MADTVKQRDTKQRREVYDAVMRRCDHPNADDIYQELRSRDSRISKGTVYRNLNILSDNEEITHVEVPGSDRYDSRLESHYHVICSMCSKVIDAPVMYNPEYDRNVEMQTGFVIKKHSMVFEGICPDCMRKAEENK